MSINKLLDEIKKDYLASLPQKIQLIRDFKDKKLFDSIRDEFHKLKGSGKTYGFPEVSQLAEKLETLCKLQSQDLSNQIELGTQILERIYQFRLKQETYDLSHCEEFSRIDAAVSSLLPPKA